MCTCYLPTKVVQIYLVAFTCIQTAKLAWTGINDGSSLHDATVLNCRPSDRHNIHYATSPLWHTSLDFVSWSFIQVLTQPDPSSKHTQAQEYPGCFKFMIWLIITFNLLSLDMMLMSGCDSRICMIIGILQSQKAYGIVLSVYVWLNNSSKLACLIKVLVITKLQFCKKFCNFNFATSKSFRYSHMVSSVIPVFKRRGFWIIAS